MTPEQFLAQLFAQQNAQDAPPQGAPQSFQGMQSSIPAGGLPSVDPADGQSPDKMMELLMGDGGGMGPGRPDPIGGVNHQGRAADMKRDAAMKMLTGGASAGK